MRHDEAIDWLFSLHRFGMKLGLENIRVLTDALGRPQDRFDSILVAGTNGKGSTSAMLHQILLASGVRSGLYTSPHLVRTEERIRIGDAEIGEDALADVLTEIRGMIDRLLAGSAGSPLPEPRVGAGGAASGPRGEMVGGVASIGVRGVRGVRGEMVGGTAGGPRDQELAPRGPEDGRLSLGAHPTFFEVITAAALRSFARAGVEVAVLEVGLGGRFDATNVVEPILSIITNIDLDHQEHLGSTRAAIAREKAGILRRGVPALVGGGGPDLDDSGRSARSAAAVARGARRGADENESENGNEDEAIAVIREEASRVGANLVLARAGSRVLARPDIGLGRPDLGTAGPSRDARSTSLTTDSARGSDVSHGSISSSGAASPASSSLGVASPSGVDASHSRPSGGGGEHALGAEAHAPLPRRLSLAIDTPVRSYPRIDAPLPGAHQAANVLLAVRAAEILSGAGAAPIEDPSVAFRSDDARGIEALRSDHGSSTGLDSGGSRPDPPSIAAPSNHPPSSGPSSTDPPSSDTSSIAARARDLPAIDARSVASGVAAARWPGRLEWVEGRPPLLLDGAHNPAGAKALADYAATLPGPPVLVFGAMRDKDARGMLSALLPVVRAVVFTRPAFERAAQPDDLAVIAASLDPARERLVEPDVAAALARARARAGAGGIVIVAGSLFLVGAVKEALALAIAGRNDR